MLNFIGIIITLYFVYIIHDFFYGFRLCFIDENEIQILKTYGTMYKNYFEISETKIYYEKIRKGLRLSWKGSILEEELMELIYEYTLFHSKSGHL